MLLYAGRYYLCQCRELLWRCLRLLRCSVADEESRLVGWSEVDDVPQIHTGGGGRLTRWLEPNKAATVPCRLPTLRRML